MQNEIIEKQLEQEKIKSEEEQKRRLLIEKQNKELEQKVSERTQELADTNEELMRQSEVLEQQVFLVEQKQKEIIDSITYAKRIQYTLLAHSELLKKHLPDYFIFFKPKDIVSGDFYWATQKNNKFYFAVCDSTGHGVPGAFMSLLNISFLNEAINEKGLVEPNHILDYVRDRLTGSVSQDGAKDGMDGTLLCFDILTKEIAYASAYNKPVLVRNNQFVELQSDKMPIGMGEKLEPFNKFILEVIPGDHVFFYTDGFADQFGGPKGKKFKYKALNELLAGNVTKSLDVQKQLLFEAFYKWKNNEEQVDDVCVVGLKF